MHFQLTQIGILCHSLGGEVILFSLQHFITPSLNLMLCLSLWLEIIACLHFRGTREAKRAVISRREDKQGIQSKEGAINCGYSLQVLLENLQVLLEINILLLVGKHELFDIILGGKHFFNKLWPSLDLRAKLDMRSTETIIQKIKIKKSFWVGGWP